MRVLQLTDLQVIDSSQKRDSGRLGDTLDAQYAPENKEQNYKRYVRELVEKTSPDLIIITGDLVYGEFDDNGSAFLDVVEFMDSFKIPWAPIFGNHDNESKMGVDWQCEQLENAEYCLFLQRELSGNGNYSVAIIQEGIPTRVLYMLDSKGCGAASEASLKNTHFSKDVGIDIDQLRWYVLSARELREIYPDINFSVATHIQPKIFAEALEKYGYSTAVNSNKDLLEPVDLGLGGDNGDFGYLGRPIKGTWDPGKSFWGYVKNGTGTDSIFVGHEHCNSISVVYEGVRLQYGQKSSLYDRVNYVTEDGSIVGSYVFSAGDPIVGGTLIVLDEKGEIVNCRIVLCE